MNIPGQTITLDAGAAIAAHRIITIGAADYAALQAAALTDPIIGVSTEVGADLDDRIDVIINGVASVEYGGTITRGDWITADADGKAVTANPSAGTNNQVIGRALISGVSGDLGSVLVAPVQIQG